MKGIEERAEKRQRSVDSAVIQEAIFVVDHQPEIFLPALKDSIPLKESTKAREHPYNKGKKQNRLK